MRYTTLLFVPLLTVTGLSAQDYLADGPLWRVRSLCGVPAPCIATDNYLYFTAGDSVIEGVTYTKVLRQGSVTYNWQASPPPLSNCSGTTNYGPDYDVPQLVRQVDRQLRIWDGTADVLLHEFDLVVGSTLPQSWTNWNEDITVSAVDSVLVGTEMRARYALQNSWAPYLIEGIGSSHGLFEPISNFFDCGYELECFGLGAESYYPVAGEACGLPMGVADLGRNEEQWTLAPNPASDAVLAKYYSDNATKFTVPERRAVSYALFDREIIAARAKPTDKEIAEYYNENKDAYAASEEHDVSRIVVPTQAAAKAARAGPQCGSVPPAPGRLACCSRAGGRSCGWLPHRWRRTAGCSACYHYRAPPRRTRRTMLPRRCAGSLSSRLFIVCKVITRPDSILMIT